MTVHNAIQRVKGGNPVRTHTQGAHVEYPEFVVTIKPNHFGLEVGTHVRKQIEYKGMFLNSDRVTRVTRLGYGIRPKMAKRGCFKKNSLAKGPFPKMLTKIA
jgi:hypothetical protein